MKFDLWFKRKERFYVHFLIYSSQKPSEIGTHSSTCFTIRKHNPKDVSDLAKAKKESEIPE